MSRRGFAKTIGLVLVTLVAVGFLWSALSRPPIGWPAEGRRVVHPDGFSIVIPPDWERHFTLSDVQGRTALQALPTHAVGNPGTFNVSRLQEPATADGLIAKGYTATTFQDKPAYEKWRTDKVDLDHSRSVVFERDGVWYDVLIRRSQSEALDRGAWLRYAETFRTEAPRKMPTIRLGPPASGPTGGPASRPATAAS